MKKIIIALCLLFITLLFVSCPNNNEEEEYPEIIHWTFQEEIPGWVAFDPARTPDYPAGTTMNIDADLPDGMTILASGRTTRWDPDYQAPVSSRFSDGYIQPNGATAAGRYALKIEDVEGPFKITINYTCRGAPDTDTAGIGYYPIIFINGEEVKQCLGTNGFDPVSDNYEYTGKDVVTIQLAVGGGGIKIYDIIIAPEGSEKGRILVDRITFNVEDFSLLIDDTRRISANVLPGTATNTGVTWTSSAESVATVNSAGLVSAIAAGSATITATARDGSGKSASLTVTVKSLPASMTAPEQIFETLKGLKATTYGWADLYNDEAGISYTNPATFTLIDDATYPNPVAKRTAFTNAINSTAEQFVIVSGDIDLSDGKVSDSDHSWFDQFNPDPPYAKKNPDISFKFSRNTTVIGINNARLMFGGLVIDNGNSNIIIRNVTFWDAHGSTANDTSKPGYTESKAGATALQLGNNPGGSGIWVDHCTFTDGTCTDLTRNYNHDGAFDIKFGRYITVSWTEFTNHDKVMLVGSNDETEGVFNYMTPSERQITLHHNYFHYATQRMPRTRGTQMHIYNNYYNEIGFEGNSGHFMGPGQNAHFIVENNYFDSRYDVTNTKIADYMDTAGYPAIVWSEGNNETVPRSNFDTGTGKPWEPAYSYTHTLEQNGGLPVSIPAEAGPKLFGN